MFSNTISASLRGMDAIMVRVEVDASQGLPGFMMVGYLSSAVKEAGERVRVALKNSDVLIPPLRITVNLAPADVRKEGTLFDLPIAAGMMKALGRLPEESTKDTVIIGELSLNGGVIPVNGVLPLIMKAKKEGYSKCIIPLANKKEGEIIPDIEVIGVGSLSELFTYLKGGTINSHPAVFSKQNEEEQTQEEEQADFADISGQESAKRAAEIAAAGFHHLLFVGPPGSGKTMIAGRIAGILPPLTKEESLEVTTVHSVAGMLDHKKGLITVRPFMAPHHTVTEQALAGGGYVPRPGIITMAHKGILFLDELTEYKKSVLNMLRQPLEDKNIRIARTGGNYIYPADFMLVGAANPCPCGYYPDGNKCKCSPAAVRKYQSRISGPILDRIDICTEVARAQMRELTENGKNESSETVRGRVLKARKMQETRFANTKYRFNSEIGAKDMEKFCSLGKAEQRLMEKVFSNMQLSARAYHRILRVARTIADLDESNRIGEIHLAEALGCRMNAEKYWE